MRIRSQLVLGLKSYWGYWAHIDPHIGDTGPEISLCDIFISVFTVSQSSPVAVLEAL